MDRKGCRRRKVHPLQGYDTPCFWAMACECRIKGAMVELRQRVILSFARWARGGAGRLASYLPVSRHGGVIVRPNHSAPCPEMRNHTSMIRYLPLVIISPTLRRSWPVQPTSTSARPLCANMAGLENPSGTVTLRTLAGIRRNPENEAVDRWRVQRGMKLVE